VNVEFGEDAFSLEGLDSVYHRILEQLANLTGAMLEVTIGKDCLYCAFFVF
jgi:hypothetical protein